MLTMSGRPTTSADGLAAGLALKWMERDDEYRLLVDQDLALIWANEPAQRALDIATDFKLRNGRIVLGNRADQDRFARFVADSTDTPQTLCLRRTEGSGHLLIGGREVERAGQRRFIGLTFRNTVEAHSWRYPGLREAFQLTSSEHKILLKMLEGLTADQVAEHFGLSVETVRSHIRKIYVKTNVTSREGLFFKLKPYRAGISKPEPGGRSR